MNSHLPLCSGYSYFFYNSVLAFIWEEETVERDQDIQKKQLTIFFMKLDNKFRSQCNYTWS